MTKVIGGAAQKVVVMSQALRRVVTPENRWEALGIA